MSRLDQGIAASMALLAAMAAGTAALAAGETLEGALEKIDVSSSIMPSEQCGPYFLRVKTREGILPKYAIKVRDPKLPAPMPAFTIIVNEPQIALLIDESAETPRAEVEMVTGYFTTVVHLNSEHAKDAGCLADNVWR